MNLQLFCSIALAALAYVNKVSAGFPITGMVDAPSKTLQLTLLL
jgi:hypothetical protein